MKQNAKSMTLILISILLALSGIAAMVASADDPMPKKPPSFYGRVMIDEVGAEPGKIVSAWTDGIERGNFTIRAGAAGEYSMEVEGGNAGDIVTFKINDTPVDGTIPSAPVQWPTQEGARTELCLYIGSLPPAGDDNDDGNGGSPAGSSGATDSTTTPETTDGESTTAGDGVDGATADSTSTESSDAQATDDGSEFHTDEPKGFGSWVLFILIGLIAVAIAVAYLRKR